MSKVLLLTRFRGEYEPGRIKKEALALGYDIDLVNYEKVKIGVSETGEPKIDLGTGKNLQDYDLIIPRAASARGKKSMVWVKTVILEYVDKLTDKPKVLNGESFKLFPLMGKLEQGVLLAQAGLPTIPFQSFSGKKSWIKYLEEKEREVEFHPVMIKMRFGSHGKNVKLAGSVKKLRSIAQKYSEGTVLIQPVLKVRRWYRVIVLGGQVLGMMKHKQKGKFQTLEIKSEVKNLRPEFSEAQFDELKRLSLDACRLFHCDYAGLDIAWEENRKEWVIFEINRTAQFKWFEKANKEINVAKSLLKI